jgi:hypothetical protein
VAALTELKALALENPGFTYGVFRKTLPTLRETTMKTFLSVFEGGLIKDFNKAHLVATLINGSRFIFRPLDDKEKLKSMEIGGFFIDEANEIDKETYDTLKSRVREKVDGKAPVRYRGIIALNPVEEDHWIPTLFLHNPPKGHILYTSTTIDNLRNLPEGYLESLRSTYSKDMQQRMIYGLFGKVHTGRPVYPQFAKGNYISSIQFDPSLPLVRGWDFGYNHPAVVWLQMRRGQIRVLGELLGKNIYLDDFITKQVLPMQAQLFGMDIVAHRDFCDPRGSDESDKGKTSVTILREHGVYPAYRRTFIEEGVKGIKSRMDTVDPDTKEPNLLVHPRCTNIIEGFRGGYHRADGSEEPEKDDFYDHLQDALRYAVLHCLQRAQINEIMKRDQAKTRTIISPHTGRRLEF